MDGRSEHIAAKQHGIISRSQALAAGMTPEQIRERVRDGRWERLQPAVYRPRSVPPTWRQGLLATVFSLGPDAVASHRAAGRMLGLDGLENAPIEISTTSYRTRAGVIVHRLRLGDVPRRRILDGIPVTEPGRTLLDLAAVLPAARAGVALDDALRRGLTTLDRLRRLLAECGGRGRDGTKLLRRLIDLRDGLDALTESALETTFLRLIRAAGLPEPVPQLEVRDANGRLVGRLDFAYPDVKVGIETEGWRYHGGYEARRKDVRRENRMKRLGWEVVTFTWDDVAGDPQGVIETIRAVLAVRAR